MVCTNVGEDCSVNVSNYTNDQVSQYIVYESTDVIAINEPLEVLMTFASNPNTPTPAWQAAFDIQDNFERNILPWIDLLGLLFTGILAIGGPLGIFALYYVRGRDPHVGVVPEYLDTPPSNLPAGIVGTLVDERAQVRDIMATIIDLAHRGYVVIEEDRKNGFLGIGGGSEFTFKRTSKSDDDLRAYEQRVLYAVFGNLKEKQLEDLKNKFYRYIPRIQKMLYTEVVENNFFPSNPESVRNAWRWIGIAITFLSGFLVISQIGDDAPPLISAVFIIVPIVLGLNGILLLIVSNYMPAKTREGAIEAAKWRAFQTYLDNLKKYDDVESASEQFSAYLPYAIIFGLEKEWVRQFDDLDSVSVFPMWYYPIYAGDRWSNGFTAGSDAPSFSDAGGLGNFNLSDASSGMSASLSNLSSGLTDLLNSASSTMTSAPSSSSSSSGGFGGGGFSSGGGGGGGSAGFG